MSNKSRVGSIVKKVLNTFTSVILAIVMIISAFLCGSRLLGYRAFTVLSGSMEPVYEVGSLIFVKEVDPEDLLVGDDITFMTSQTTVVTHRIIDIVPDEDNPNVLRFKTQGVANDKADSTLVHYRNIIGSPAFSIPLAGYVASFVQNPPGTYIALSAAAFILMLLFLPDLLFSEDEKEAESSKEESSEEK